MVVGVVLKKCILGVGGWEGGVVDVVVYKKCFRCYTNNNIKYKIRSPKLQFQKVLKQYRLNISITSIPSWIDQKVAGPPNSRVIWGW